MNGLSQHIKIRTAYTRSINLPRDYQTLELIQAYVPTSRAIQALEQVAAGLGQQASQRALALIGPYGSGKSAFALFLAALLSPASSPTYRAALATLHEADPILARQFGAERIGQHGFLRVPVSGIPDSLVRQLLLALVGVMEQQHGFTKAEVDELRAAVRPDTTLDHVVMLIRRIQQLWAVMGGTGLLIEIDELGKFLEYESYHPQHREIHLLQLLAESAHEAHAAPLHLVVLLHQGFEYYSHRLGKQLSDEWRKVQGRFNALAFLEPAEQSLRIISAAFEPVPSLPDKVMMQLNQWLTTLATAETLPPGLDEASARNRFARCYPLHPLTLLILPVLCQKIAQNERTLFSYLGSVEPFGLQRRLAEMQWGDWIEPWELYDYFMLNEVGGFSDALTERRWAEVMTALERLGGSPVDPAVRLLKTVGLLNLIGVQRGLKASLSLLELLFGPGVSDWLAQLEAASILHFRHYSEEYRVWQGSDFDLPGAIQQLMAELAAVPLADTLNQWALLKPVVARRVSIVTGALRCFMPGFTDSARCGNSSINSGGGTKLPPLKKGGGGDFDSLRLLFCLVNETELPVLDPTLPQTVLAFCTFATQLRETVGEWQALQELPERYAVLNHDPVAQREYRVWLEHAEIEAMQWIRGVLEEPEALRWFWAGEERTVLNRRDLQRQLSAWVESQCYPQSPLISNELINWDRPSPSANTGRKRLLAAMLNAADQDDLAIQKSPAEKSLYLSLLKASGLHRCEGERWGFYPPPEADPCRFRPVWEGIAQVLGNGGERQIAVMELYTVLRQPPYGVKLGVLPVLLVAYLLAHRREVALYQEGGFCEDLTLEQVELLCRRPELFALERFALGGLRGELFDRYLRSVVGKVREDATLLDIVRPLVRFVSGLPEYTLHCRGLSREAVQVRAAFQQAKSPGVLLFEALPAAFGIAPADFIAGHVAVVEQFITQLVAVLRELKQAYEKLLHYWQSALNQALLDESLAELTELRLALAERYGSLDRYTPDRMGLGALIRRLADTGHGSDQAWLESVATLLGRAPPHKWREETRLQAELRLYEMAEQLRDLEKLRMAAPDGSQVEGALLVKMVDPYRGEISRVIQLSSDQRESAAVSAAQIADRMSDLDESVQLAVVAALLERFSLSSNKPQVVKND